MEDVSAFSEEEAMVDIADQDEQYSLSLGDSSIDGKYAI